tara:strand:- start:986 stop:1402 length:417 start_codon:yes stop_codon:yes gene_type:complete
MRPVTIRIDEFTEKYLLDLSSKYNGASIGNVIKNLLKWCENNNININEKHSVFDDETKKMIEQIHVATPHLLLLTRMNTQDLLDSPTEKVTEVRDKAIKYLNKTCGSFQSAHYDNIRVTINNVGLKQAPESEENTTWK